MALIFSNLGGANSLELLTTSGIGAPNGATVSVVEKGNGTVHKTILTLTATPVTITDDPGAGQYGNTAKLYDFPAGLIVTLGAVIDGALTLGVTGTITNNYDGSIALGTTTPTSTTVLTSTGADYLQSTAMSTAVSKVAVADAFSVAAVLTEFSGRCLNGTATAIDLYLNVVITDSASHTSGTGTFTGTVTILWTNAGTTS